MTTDEKYRDSARRVIVRADDAGNISRELHKEFGKNTKELDRFFAWCEINGFSIIINLYLEEI